MGTLNVVCESKGPPRKHPALADNWCRNQTQEGHLYALLRPIVYFQIIHYDAIQTVGFSKNTKTEGLSKIGVFKSHQFFANIWGGL